MAETELDWGDILGWGEEQKQDLRYAGFSFYREGRYEQAHTFFAALEVLDPKNLYDKQTLGAINLQLGNNEKALDLLNEALKMDPTDEQTLLNKTKALLMLGKKSDAFAIAKRLQKSADPILSNDAMALLLAYS